MLKTLSLSALSSMDLVWRDLQHHFPVEEDLQSWVKYLKSGFRHNCSSRARARFDESRMRERRMLYTLAPLTELKVIRRAMLNESLPVPDGVIEAVGQAFVLANDISPFDVSTLAETTDSGAFPETGSHDQMNLETLQRLLHLHRMDDELDLQHNQSYYNQLQEWKPPQGSFASLVQTDLLQALATEISTLHPPHDSHSRSLIDSHLTFQRPLGRLAMGLEGCHQSSLANNVSLLTRLQEQHSHCFFLQSFLALLTVVTFIII